MTKPEFEAFHCANQWVYDLLCARARDLKAAGYRTAPSRGPFESARLSDEMKKFRDEHPERVFGLDNALLPWYARMIDAQEEDLKGFFPMRRTREEIAKEVEDAGQQVMELE